MGGKVGRREISNSDHVKGNAKQIDDIGGENMEVDRSKEMTKEEENDQPLELPEEDTKQV